jgi:hypothetical protein
MGMTATRLMTKSISGYKFARNVWLYGGNNSAGANLDKGSKEGAVL